MEKTGRHLLWNVKCSEGRKISTGDVFYLMGTTKVKIVGNEDCLYPSCEILEATPASKYRVGEVNRVYIKVLYQRKKGLKNRGRK